MPTGGTSLHERKARAFDERAHAATATFGLALLGAWSPGPLELTRTTGKRGRVHRLKDDDEPAKPTKPSPRRDLTAYVWAHADGRRVELTRSDFGTFAQVNAGSVHDLLRGRVQSAKGWRMVGRADDKDIDD